MNVPLIVVAGAVVLLLLARRRDRIVGIWIANTTAIAAVGALAIEAGALDSVYGRWVLGALALSMAGDLLLIPDSSRSFRLGLLSFLGAHLVYGAAFLERGVDPAVAVWAGLAMLALGGLALRWLWPGLGGVFRVAVPVYVVAIGAMAALAAGATAESGSALPLVGATLFCVSDVFVARQRFVQSGFSNAVWGLPLYFGGQCLLAASVAMATPPHLVLVMIDTLRADHLGAYGYARDTSPNLDRLARAGSYFVRARATSSWTKPSVGSLFTSQLPSEHGATSFGRGLDSDVPVLAELLRAAGYRTLGVSGNFVHVTEEQGFARGFDSWKALAFRLAENEGDPLLRYRGTAPLRAPTAPEINFAALHLLAESPRRQAPVFLYVHYMEPHSGYLPPPEFSERFVEPWTDGPAPRFTSDYLWRISREGTPLDPALRERMIGSYDAEIAAVDAGLGRLVMQLEKLGYWDNSVVVVVSDHGEEFFEHGRWNHGMTLYDESLRVPLIVLDNRDPRGGVRRDEPVDLLDVAPTLLALAGAPIPAVMRGRDLLASELAPRDGVAELHPDAAFEVGSLGRPHRASLLRWPWKGIARRDGTLEAYDLESDPAERTPSKRVPGSLAADASDLARWLDQRSGGQEDEELDAAARARLRALGYVE